MIGVSAPPTDLPLVQEFFELFKTPWEPSVASRRYGLVISTDGCIEHLDADLFVVYGSGSQSIDESTGVTRTAIEGPSAVEWKGSRFPLFGRASVFSGLESQSDLTLQGQPAGYRCEQAGRRIVRIGYDLFHEVKHLLTEGQPPADAATPTLELHVAVMRDLLESAGIPFLEIPPKPDGYDFTCCLTHDIDFYGIRRHGMDQTVSGFIGRASAGSVANLLLGRRTVSELMRNWLAIASLPFVQLGLARDFWSPLTDYATADGGRPATFFMIPFKDKPGVAPNGAVARHRAVAYGVAETGPDLQRVAANGAEVAVHGIDAWRDPEAGRAEMTEVRNASGQVAAGVRMHWLYFAPDSPQQLESAGFEYDSTFGYNDAIGFRSGTAQVFKLPGTRDLLELSLSIMDTALFYRDRMWLTPAQALERCGEVIASAARFGGVIVINWHDRSLAPERLWGERYRALIARVEATGRPWFATASDAVSWFRWRRSITFATNGAANAVSVSSAPRPSSLPAASIVVYNPGGSASRNPPYNSGSALRNPPYNSGSGSRNPPYNSGSASRNTPYTFDGRAVSVEI